MHAQQPFANAFQLKDVAHQFHLRWSFYCSMVVRDLTLRSAPSFGTETTQMPLVLRLHTRERPLTRRADPTMRAGRGPRCCHRLVPFAAAVL